MNEIIVEETGLPLRFPNPRELAYLRAQEFRHLSPQDRLASLLDVLNTGMLLMRQSPNRQSMDRLFLKRESEWQRIQRELFAHAK